MESLASDLDRSVSKLGTNIKVGGALWVAGGYRLVDSLLLLVCCWVVHVTVVLVIPFGDSKTPKIRRTTVLCCIVNLNGAILQTVPRGLKDADMAGTGGSILKHLNNVGFEAATTIVFPCGWWRVRIIMNWSRDPPLATCMVIHHPATYTSLNKSRT